MHFAYFVVHVNVVCSSLHAQIYTFVVTAFGTLKQHLELEDSLKIMKIMCIPSKCLNIINMKLVCHCHC